MKKNKIISKTLRPYVETISVCTLVALLCFGMLNKGAISLKKEYNSIQSNVITGANLVLIGFIAYFFLTSVLYLHNSANKFAIETAKKYINQKISEKPEYEQFCNVLKDPDALKRIATLVSNELNDTEQKRITEIVNRIELAHQESQSTEAMYKIINIIEEHASVHPEFINKVYSALARESYDIYVKQKQNENAKLLRQQKTK